ncbi:MAG: isocitrate lyase/PEP mutase family protein [Acidimicrobiales bacterium]
MGDFAADLRGLHRPGNPVVLPNVWDATSARLFVEAGFEALATSSGAVARTLGFDDGEQTPVDEMFAAISRITRSVSVPITADVERGYGLAPTQIVARLLDAGAAGCNLEDSNPATGELVDTAEQAAWLGEVRAAAGDQLVVNARIDVHLREFGEPAGRVDEAARRARAYLEAGADSVYPITLRDEHDIEHFVHAVPGPVNILYASGGPSLLRLAELGVARVTFGSGLHRQATAAVKRLAENLRADSHPYG